MQHVVHVDQIRKLNFKCHFCNNLNVYMTLVHITLNPTLMLIEFSFASSFDPLLLELIRCLLSAINGLRDPLSSRSSTINYSATFMFDAPISTSSPVLLKFVGVSLPFVNVCSFFFCFLCRLCCELLKLVPPFFFIFLPGSVVETTMLPSSFMCASRFLILLSLLGSFS